MPSNTQRIGPPTVELSIDSSVLVPSLSSLTFSASGVTATEVLVNDGNPSLSSTDTYQVCLGLVGRDDVNKGYTVGQCSPSSGNLTITSGQVIKVSVSNGNW